MRGEIIPGITLIAAMPEGAGGGAEGQLISIWRDLQRVAIDEVVGMFLRQAIGAGGESFPAIARAGDDEFAVDRDAQFVFYRRYKPRGAGILRVNRYGETKSRRSDVFNFMPASEIVGGLENTVVVLGPEMVGRAGALDESVRILDIGIATLVGRHVSGAHALGTVFPVRAVVFADPDAAAGDAEDDAAAVARVDGDGVDARVIVAAAEPFPALREIPEGANELPVLAVVF